ncbi:Gfo/Idh/MocA family oxidoreductase [Parafrigoribacterium mesophilum]
MAGVHANAWLAEGSAPISWVCSPSQRGRELAARVGAQWTPSIEEVLADTSVTILDLCTPTGTHPFLVEAGIDGGRHVLVEKPIALDGTGAARIKDVYRRRRAGQVVMVAHVLQFFGGYQRLIQAVDDDAIGQPACVMATRFGEKPNWSRWITDPGQSGGPLVDLLVHDFDLANRLLGRPEAVTARETAGSYAVTVTYQEGRTALVTGGSALPSGTPFSSSIQVVGSDGILSHRFVAAAADATVPDGQVDLLSSSGRQSLDVAPSDPYQSQIHYFLDCVATGREPVAGSVDSAAAALGVSRAAVRSMTSGREEDPADAS